MRMKSERVLKRKKKEAFKHGVVARKHIRMKTTSKDLLEKKNKKPRRK